MQPREQQETKESPKSRPCDSHTFKTAIATCEVCGKVQIINTIKGIKTMKPAFVTEQEASKLVNSIFASLPIPELEPEYTRYGILDSDGTQIRIYTSEDRFYDSYTIWICARALKTEPKKRKAVAIRWTQDELLDDGKAIRTKLEYAVTHFNELAEEFESGGKLPSPVKELS